MANRLPGGRGVVRTLRPLWLVGVVWSCGGGDATGPGGPHAPEVASVEVTPDTLELVVGQTARLTATPRAADGTALTGKTVTWSSEEPGIATVDQEGLVTAISEESVRITATVDGKSGTCYIVISSVPVATVTVVPDPAVVAVGRTAQLTAVTLDAEGDTLRNRSIDWETSDAAVATVSETGVVTGVAVGEVTITATSEGRSGTSRLTVSATEVASVVVDPATTTVVMGGTVELTATARDGLGAILLDRPVAWATSDAGVAEVDMHGTVTGIGPGSVTITATIEGTSGEATVTVTEPEPTTRTWRGGARGRESDWSAGTNWDPQGKPLVRDTVLIPGGTDPAMLTEDVHIARLILAGGRLRTGGHLLRIASPIGPTLRTAGRR
jgi:uncharacterized protein YjdB